MIGFTVIIAIFAVAALTYWIITIKPNEEATDLLHEYECMKLYLSERHGKNEGLFLCRIAREEMFSDEFRLDLEERLMNILETDADLFISSDSIDDDNHPVADTPIERVEYGDPFWNWNDYAHRLDFLDRIIRRIQDNG